MKLLFIVVLLVLGTTVHAQVTSTFFGHLHYSGTAANKFSRDIPIAPDSTYTGLRPTATAAIGYSKGAGTTVLAFAGFGYFHLTRHSTTNTYNTDYGISLQLGTGASAGPVSLTNATTIGLFGQFFNNLLTVGIGYNFSNKSILPLVGPGIAFH